MIKLKCPHCNQLLQIPEQYAGQTGACKHCQQKLTVPELAGDLLVDAPARPEAIRRRKWMPFAAGGAVAAVLALGIFMFVSRDAPPPASAPSTAPSPEAPQSAIEAAQQLAIEGKYREAIQAFEKVRSENPQAVESIHGLHFAAVYVALGDHAGHERLCRWLFSAYGQPQIVRDAGRTAKAYLINPKTNDQELLRQAAENGRIGTGVAVLGFRPITRGMGEYRIGNYKEAALWIEKSIHADYPRVQNLARTFLAMTEFKLDNMEKANRLLQEARNQIASFPKIGSEEYAAGWVDNLIAEVSLREAEALFKTGAAQASTPTDTVQYLPATTLEAFTVFMRDHGVGKDPNGIFRLVDGVLAVSGAEIGMLFTNEEYENYKLEVDYKWLSDRPDRDSGIFVNILGREGKEHKPGDKMRAIEVNILGPKMFQQNSLSGQIWLFSQQGDTVKLTVDGRVYTKNTAASAPPEDFENPIGEWNTMEITSAHGRFLVKLNGKVAVDATDPIPSRGKIVLQSSRGEIHFGRMVLTLLE